MFGPPQTYSTFACGGDLDPSSPLARRAQQIGHACQFAVNFPFLAQEPVAGFVNRLTIASALGQMKVYLSPYGRCVGFVVWAFLAPDVESQLIGDKPLKLHDWQYNEGTSAWIMDLAVASGSLPYVLDDLKDTVFHENSLVRYVRWKNTRRFVRVWRREESGRFSVGQVTSQEAFQ